MLQPHYSSCQRGAVLIISLIVLLLLTLVGTTGTRVTNLEEKMAGNMRDRNLAFQAAESTLEHAEISLATAKTFSTSGTSSSGDGYYSLDSTIPTANSVIEDGFWTSHPVATYSTTRFGNGIANPQYIIQQLAPLCATATTPCPAGDVINTYRITARASGGTASSVVILQSILQIP